MGEIWMELSLDQAGLSPTDAPQARAALDRLDNGLNALLKRVEIAQSLMPSHGKLVESDSPKDTNKSLVPVDSSNKIEPLDTMSKDEAFAMASFGIAWKKLREGTESSAIIANLRVEGLLSEKLSRALDQQDEAVKKYLTGVSSEPFIDEKKDVNPGARTFPTETHFQDTIWFLPERDGITAQAKRRERFNAMGITLQVLYTIQRDPRSHPARLPDRGFENFTQRFRKPM